MSIIKNDLSPSKCPLCQSNNISKLGFISYSKPTYYSSKRIELLNQPDLWKCKECNSKFIGSGIQENDSIKLYAEGDASKRWISNCSFEDGKTGDVVSTLRTLFKPGTHLLDIGCNTGELLDFASQQGCETFGCDYSQASLNIIRDKGHIAFSSMEEIQDKFDLIVAFDLIEHLYDVPTFLEACYELLREQGKIIFFTGDISSFPSIALGLSWWYLGFPEHIVFPSKTYLKNHPKFNLTKWMKTYHSIYCKGTYSFLLRLRTAASAIFRSRVLRQSHSIFPTFGPDHVLVVLEKLEGE
ncbi:MAG: class I SAM-dependent methyltransferase [Cyanobacteria bacterium J06581_3]